MTWWEYAQRIGGDKKADLAQAAGVTPSAVTRWAAGAVPDAATVAKFARTYERPVIEAFVAAGFLTESEAKVRPVAQAPPPHLTDEQLIEMIRARLLKAGGSDDQSPPMTVETERTQTGLKGKVRQAKKTTPKTTPH